MNKKVGSQIQGITKWLKLAKKDIDTGVHIFIIKISPFKSLKEIIVSRKKKVADILPEKMIDNSLCSQDDSGCSDQDESTEFDIDKKTGHC